MTDRLQEILRREDLTAAKFASALGVQPSAISHLLSGRNKPGYDFFCRFIVAYPQYNLEWLLIGRQPMLKEDNAKEPTSAPVIENDKQDNEQQPANNTTISELSVNPTPSIVPAQNSPKKPSNPAAPCKVLVLYEDSTFESYNHR